MRVLLLCAVFGVAARVPCQLDPQRDFVCSGKNAFVVLPAEFVCGPSIKQVTWSLDGLHLAVLRETLDIRPVDVVNQILGQEGDKPAVEPETQIIAWNSVSRRATTLLRLPASQGEIRTMDWITGSSSLVVQAEMHGQDSAAPSHVSLMILTTAGKSTTVAHLDPGKQLDVEPSPVKPIVALLDGGPRFTAAPDGSPPHDVPDEKSSVRFMGTDGVLSQSIELPGSSVNFLWRNNGLPYVMTFERNKGGKGIRQVWHLINRESQKLEPVTAPPREDLTGALGSDPTLVLRDLTAKLSISKLGIYAPSVVISASDAPDTELTLVTSDGSGSELSPKLNGISYLYQGSLMVREMAKVPLEAYLRAKEEALKAKLVNQAKQVALALIMYSNDYDDVMLSNAGDWQSQLEPYMRNKSLTDGFNYTFPGGNANSIADPANTPLGYISGPGGRAVAYADGHVRWVPNP